MEEIEAFTFTQIETQLGSLASRDAREQLLQWNVDTGLMIQKFRINGAFSTTAVGEYERLLRDFVRCPDAMAALEITGSASTPTVIDMEQLGTNVMSMAFFDRLEEHDITSGSGAIRGCFEETFDGISVGDKLREMLVNPDSENASVFSDSERRELLFRLFRLLVVGGAMCQPDTNTTRYFALTQALYRDTLTVYRDAKTDAVQVAGRAFAIRHVDGLSLFSHPDSPINQLIAIVDPIKRHVLVIKMNFKPFW